MESVLHGSLFFFELCLRGGIGNVTIAAIVFYVGGQGLAPRLQAQDVARLPADLRPLWDDLDERYKISQKGPDGKGDYLQINRFDVYGFWLRRIHFFTKELVEKDLKLVEMLEDHFVRTGRNFGNLNSLKSQLLLRSKALTSLEQTGTRQAMEILCLLLSELSEIQIITEGTSNLAEQPTAILQDLCKLLRKTMESWDDMKNLDKWCGYFYQPLWLLQGRGVDSSKALEDLQLIQAKTQGIIAARIPPDILKLQVVKMEEKFEKLQQYQEVFDHQLKMQKDHFKHKEAQLEQKVKELEQDALSAKEANEKHGGELLGMKEEMRQLKEENENMKSQGLEVDGKVNQLEENNILFSKQLHEQLQKLEDERLRIKEDLVDFKNDKLKMKEELMECNSGKLKILVDLNSDKLKMKEALDELKLKFERLKFNAIQVDVSDVSSELSSWVQVRQDMESSTLHSASSAFCIRNQWPPLFHAGCCFQNTQWFFRERNRFAPGLDYSNCFKNGQGTFVCFHRSCVKFSAPMTSLSSEHLLAQVQRHQDPRGRQFHHSRGRSPSGAALCAGNSAPPG